LVLCYLEGMTHDLAARQLDCPVGTVRSRLARARSLLHRRITRRGITLSTTGLGALLESNARAAFSARLPAMLVDSIRGAALGTVPHTGMGLFASFTTILEGVLSVSHFKKIAILATAISVGGVASMVVGRTTAGQTLEQASPREQVIDGPVPPEVALDEPKKNPQPEANKNAHVPAIESRLDDKISFNIYEQPLSGAVGFIQSYTGLNIVLDPKALSDAGLTSASPVTLSIKQVKLRTALKLLLKPLGLAYKIEDEVILITGPETAGAVAKAPYPKTYYVGDLVIPPQRQPITAPATGVQSKVDLMPLMDLITFSVAPGTWNVQDGYGHAVPSRKPARGDAPADQHNAIVPFFLSISLIIQCPADVHDDIAHFLRCLRRLQDCRSDSEDEGRRVLLPNPQRSPETAAANPGSQTEVERRNKINQLMKELNGLLDASNGKSEPESNSNKRTKAADMPDVDVVVSESKRVVDVDGQTSFRIRLRNYGGKDATNLQVCATLSPNLEVQNAGGPKDVDCVVSPKKDQLRYSQITKLGSGKEMILWATVKVTGPQPKLATCRVVITHDDQTDTFEDMAGFKVKVSPSSALGSVETNRR
jgi:uncharacterized repeat protein (TIGR01451 family)